MPNGVMAVENTIYERCAISQDRRPGMKYAHHEDSGDKQRVDEPAPGQAFSAGPPQVEPQERRETECEPC